MAHYNLSSPACATVQTMPNLLPPCLFRTNLPETYELQNALGICFDMYY